MGTIDARTPVAELLTRFGPEGGEGVERGAGVAYARALARSHYENFSVLTRLVPPDLRDDFAAVYAFCRWADDLGDEIGADEASRAESLRLLGWWRTELEACFARAGSADDGGGVRVHPVFAALEPVARKHGLPIEPFDNLIRAFEQDQTVTRYSTWDEVVGYCRLSADPVGRIVLHLGGYPNEPANAELVRMSDSICTALQLTNHWQDVRRDLLERDRVYLPSDETGLSADDLRGLMDRGDDFEARLRYIRALRPLVDRTREMFEAGRELPERLSPRIGHVVWLLGAGGEAVLDRVERGGCTTLWSRPRLGTITRARLLGRAWVGLLRAKKARVVQPSPATGGAS